MTVSFLKMFINLVASFVYEPCAVVLVRKPVDHISEYSTHCHVTSQGGRISRAPASRSGRSENPKIAGSSPESAALKPDHLNH